MIRLSILLAACLVAPLHPHAQMATATKANRDAVGARVYVFARNRRLSGEVQTGTSYLSQNDPRLHFGLADESSYDRIEVQWPGGAREVFPRGQANRIVVLKEGTGSRVNDSRRCS